MKLEDIQRQCNEFKADNRALAKLEYVFLDESQIQAIAARIPTFEFAAKPLMIGGQPRGTNKVIIATDRIDSSEELNSVLRHESLGHMAIQSRPALERDMLFTKIAQSIEQSPDTKAFYKEQIEDSGYGAFLGANAINQASMQLQCEELYCRVMESDETPTDKCWDTFKEKMSEGFSAAGNFTLDDIKCLAHNAHISMNKNPAIDAKARFALEGIRTGPTPAYMKIVDDGYADRQTDWQQSSPDIALASASSAQEPTEPAPASGPSA